MPPKKRTKQKPPRGAKKEFVASMPLSMPVADVVAKASAQGISLNNHQVSNIRWNVKKQTKAAAPLPPKGPKLRTATRTRTTTTTKPPSVPPSANGHSPSASHLAKEQLRTLAIQIGLIETRIILDEVEASLGRSS